MKQLWVLACALSALPSVSYAQSAGGSSIDPSKEPPPMETTVVGDRSPPATQDRLFGGTRYWLLDPGRFEAEVWWAHKYKKDGSDEGLLQVEVEIGLVPHLQLDIYQNFTVGEPGFAVEGNQLEIRYSFGRKYNEIPLNPVLYLEWHPRAVAQDRAEIRMLLGGDMPFGGIWAANVYAETNVDRFNSESAEGTDAEMGVTGALSFPLVKDVLRLGAELRAGVDQHGEPAFAPVAMLGPNIVLKAPKVDLKFTATVLFGLMPQDPRVQPLVIAGWGW